MRLRQLQIKNFGKLHDYEITLDDGINVIYGPNESGKSTIHAFIRSMLYGIQRQRGRAAKNDIYTRYEPWENGSYYAGMIRFESGGKLFRLSRSFYKNDIKEELICETDGERLSIEQGDLKMLLGDVSETVFDNTVSISQLNSQTNEELYRELRNYMANYEGSYDGDLNIDNAMDILKTQKKEYQNQKRLELEKQESQKRDFISRIKYIQEELRDYRGQAEELSSQSKQQSSSAQASGHQSIVLASGLGLGAVLGVLTGILSWGKLPFPVSLVLFCSGILLGLLSYLAFAKRHRHQITEAQRKEEQQHNIWTIRQLQESSEEKQKQLDNLNAEYEEYCELIRSPSTADQEIAAIDLAMSAIQNLSGNMQGRIERQMRTGIAHILKELTNDRYTSVEITEGYEIGLHSQDKYIPLNQVSRGTIEQVYFALRMTAAEILCHEEPLPLILDETFALYDETRLKAALTWLTHHQHQSIIFTCTKREPDLITHLNLPANIITL